MSLGFTATDTHLSKQMFFQTIYKNVSIACVVLDLEGLCQHSNIAFAQLTGRAESEVLGDSFFAHLHPDELDHFRELFASIITGRIASFELENRLVRKDGTLVWVKCALYSVAEVPGEGTFIVAQVSDISRKMRIREKLRSSERSLEQFFDNAPIGMLWLDQRGGVTRINQSLLAMIGVEEAIAHGSSISDWVAQPELDKILALLQQTGKANNFRARIQRADGAGVCVLVDAVSICEGPVLKRTDWFFRDISHRINLEQRVIEAAETERRELGHELHDELGQILHGAYFIASSLKQKLKCKQIEEHVEMDRVSVCLSEAMLSVRNLARGLQPVSSMPEGLVRALEEHAANVSQLYSINCQFICLTPVEIVDPKVAMHLFRIVQEAVCNAVKHSKCHRIRIILKLIQRAQNALILEVNDDGKCQIPENTTRAGMGLRVMQFRAHAIGGSLAVERTSRGGTAVSCSIVPFLNEL